MLTKNAKDASVQAQYPAVKFAYDNVAKEIGTLQVVFGTHEEYNNQFGGDTKYGDIAFYDGRRFFLNEEQIDMNSRTQVTSILAHEVGHSLYAPMDKQIQAIEYVIVQKAFGCGGIPTTASGISAPPTHLQNLIDDEIVNISVIRFSNPEVSREMREWIKEECPIKNMKIYVKTGDALWDFHVDVMMNFAKYDRYPRSTALQAMVDKGKGISDPQGYFRNYYRYAKYIKRVT